LASTEELYGMGNRNPPLDARLTGYTSATPGFETSYSTLTENTLP